MNIITKYPSKFFKINNNNVVNVLSGLSFTGEKFNKHNIEKVNLKNLNVKINLKSDFKIYTYTNGKL